MEAILTLLVLIVMLLLTIVSIYKEIKDNKEFKELLNQLSYEDTLNDISNIIKEKWKESTKIAKIKDVLNKLKKKQ